MHKLVLHLQTKTNTYAYKTVCMPASTMYYVWPHMYTGIKKCYKTKPYTYCEPYRPFQLRWIHISTVFLCIFPTHSKHEQRQSLPNAPAHTHTQSLACRFTNASHVPHKDTVNWCCTLIRDDLLLCKYRCVWTESLLHYHCHCVWLNANISWLSNVIHVIKIFSVLHINPACRVF